MKSFSARFERRAQKGIVHIIPLLVVVAIAAVAIWFFLNKGGLGSKGTMVPIPPSQLMPFVSVQEARKTICDLKKNGLFAEACQNKFDVVGKEDIEKIAELFVLLDKIQNDKSIPDYERLLLAQAVFAVLPIEDNPETSLYQPTLLSRLRDYLTSKNIAYAQEKAMSDEAFKKLMERDLQNVVDSLPKGDNAWVINMMVSKYSWKDGKSQPLYSHQYGEVFDPFPNNPNVNTRDINYNIQSVVGSKASGQTVDSEMLAYSFTIMSWNSREYTGKEELVDEKFLVRKRNRSDSSYQGEPYLNNLLDAVKMPSTKKPVESSDKDGQTDQMKGEPRDITCEEFKKIVAGECPAHVWYDDNLTGDPTKDPKIWCFSADDDFDFIDDAVETQPPDYIMKLSEWKKCKEYL